LGEGSGFLGADEELCVRSELQAAHAMISGNDPPSSALFVRTPGSV
jgi:hypothetical protein